MADSPDAVRKFVYGPVPSRRLGFSLGVDVLPFKTCTLDCVYCQLGASSKTTVRRGSFFKPEDVLARIREALDSGAPIDFITFSGSGEPTLNRDLGRLIRGIKAMTDIPVAVLTNGTILHRKDVREALAEADLVVPSLDAVTPGLFARVNRPDRGISLDRMIKGMTLFRRGFKGRIWLEIMLIKGVNDSPGHIRKLKAAIEALKPDKVQLNTVVRPPAEKGALPLGENEMEAIRKTLGEGCEITVEFPKKAGRPLRGGLDQAVLSIVGRRPVTAGDVVASLGRSPSEVRMALSRLVKTGKVRKTAHGGKAFFFHRSIQK
jgi:wyosine [tRNA(Phe)-imidazoG37] synthetase (radical SAM superfamily)